MLRKNDFSKSTKIRLAERAGYKCCYLGCGKATIGPSKEKNNTEKNNTGVAAHIYSASLGKGARRIPPIEMTSNMIKSLENGIWMCPTHGEYIDNDEKTFTVNQLKEWKEIGEKVAEKMQEFKYSYHQALTELEQYKPGISKMIIYAQKFDPGANRFYTLDLQLYKKILNLIPKSVISCARGGFFVNRHSHTLREKIVTYLDTNEYEPIDFSFHNEILQRNKIQMDKALDKLSDYLSTVTFFDEVGNHYYYGMNQELKLTEEGLSLYKTQVDNIYKYCNSFVKAYDSFYKKCRDYYLK